MEEKLKRLFDYQRFEGNLRLNDIINKTERKYFGNRALSDDDMSYVAAAGVPNANTKKNRDDC